MIKLLLSQFEKLLLGSNAHICHLLQEGKVGIEITEKLASVRVRELQDVVELYKWKNGVSDSIESINEAELFPEGIMLSLETAIETYIIYTNRGLWKSDLFPLFTNGGGDYLLVNTIGEENHIYMYAPSVLLSEEPVRAYESLEKLFMTVAKCFDEEAYFFTEDKLMDLDFDLKYKISSELNPSCEFWKL
jgi:hypothetical protein